MTHPYSNGIEFAMECRQEYAPVVCSKMFFFLLFGRTAASFHVGSNKLSVMTEQQSTALPIHNQYCI